MRVEQATGSSWRKQPPVNFMQRMTSASPFDKLKVIGGNGEALPKSPYYEKMKASAAAYKSFYSIPDKIPEIKIAKQDKPEKQKDDQDAQVQQLAKQDRKVIEFRPYLKPVEEGPDLSKTGNNEPFKSYISNYQGFQPEVVGENIDIYV